MRLYLVGLVVFFALGCPVYAEEQLSPPPGFVREFPDYNPVGIPMFDSSPRPRSDSSSLRGGALDKMLSRIQQLPEKLMQRLTGLAQSLVDNVLGLPDQLLSSVEESLTQLIGQFVENLIPVGQLEQQLSEFEKFFSGHFEEVASVLEKALSEATGELGIDLSKFVGQVDEGLAELSGVQASGGMLQMDVNLARTITQEALVNLAFSQALNLNSEKAQEARTELFALNRSIIENMESGVANALQLTEQMGALSSESEQAAAEAADVAGRLPEHLSDTDSRVQECVSISQSAQDKPASHEILKDLAKTNACIAQVLQQVAQISGLPSQMLEQMANQFATMNATLAEGGKIDAEVQKTIGLLGNLLSSQSALSVETNQALQNLAVTNAVVAQSVVEQRMRLRHEAEMSRLGSLSSILSPNFFDISIGR